MTRMVCSNPFVPHYCLTLAKFGSNCHTQNSSDSIQAMAMCFAKRTEFFDRDKNAISYITQRHAGCDTTGNT